MSGSPLAEPPDEAPDRTLPIGSMVGGRYRICKVLGMGGNGAVYEGEHASVGHRVAIKVVHPILADRDDITARFHREAPTCGTLRHPNVGQVYDVGELEDGAPYMVMELQDGRSLADVLDDTRLPLPAAIDITRQLLGALGAAHHAGVIHRDVKPDNLMIVRNAGGDVIVKLVDFGISKQIGGQRQGDITGEGFIVGSPDYMSPEQLRGDALDGRTDVYSTGVLLYEAISGQLPFDKENISDLFASVLRDPIPSLVDRRADCPPELERVVFKAMARKPKDRYQDTTEMIRALSQVDDTLRHTAPSDLASLSEPPPEGRQTGQQPRRRTIDNSTLKWVRDQSSDAQPVSKTAVAAPKSGEPKRSARRNVGRAILLATAAIVGLGLVALWHASDSEREAQAIVATPSAGDTSATSAAAAKPPVAGGPTAIRARRQEPARAEPVPQASPTREPRAGSQPAHEGPAKQSAAEPARKARTPQRARTKQPKPEPPQPVPPSPEEIQAMLKRAATAFVTGQHRAALALYSRVVAVAPGRAVAWRGIGLASSRLGNRTRATSAFQRYLKLRPHAQDAAQIQAQLERLQ